MPAVIALVLFAIVALAVLSFAVHVLFSPWLLVAIAILAWDQRWWSGFRPGHGIGWRSKTSRVLRWRGLGSQACGARQRTWLRSAWLRRWPGAGAFMPRREYVPEGGGSHHWKVTGKDGLARFVTVDDLDDKDWLGDTREAVFSGLGRSLGTAAALRDRAGLDFVAAPLPDRDGELLRRANDRYAVSVFPFLAGAVTRSARTPIRCCAAGHRT